MLTYEDIMLMCICIENPYYRLLTNHTIFAPLASSPVISIIVAIDSDGTVSQQDNIVTDSLVLARPNDEDFIGVFEQDSNDFQLYHYMFSPLQRQNMGQYVIFAGTYHYYYPEEGGHVHMHNAYFKIRISLESIDYSTKLALAGLNGVD